MEILRKRQNNLFLALIRYQERDTKQSKTPINILYIYINILYIQNDTDFFTEELSRMCIVCKKVKPFALFAIRTRQSHVDTCKHCYYLKVSIGVTV